MSSSTKSMKLLFIIYALKGGGAERVAVNLMNRLSEEHEVTVCTLTPRDPKNEYPLSDRVEVIVLPQEKGWGKWTYYRAWTKRLRRLKRERGFDASVSFLEQGNFLNVASRLRSGPRTIVSVRNHMSAKWRVNPPTDKRLLTAKAWDRRADYVVCVSDAVARDQVENFHIEQRRVRVINNWVDCQAVEEAARLDLHDQGFEEFTKKHPFIFSNSGRLILQKGQWHLFRALAELRRTHPDAGLVVLGEGVGKTDLHPQLVAEIDRLGLGEHVYLAGRQANPFSYLIRTDAFVLPSLFEGFSNAMLEALALGLPIIADDCSGVRECLAPGCSDAELEQGAVYGDYGVVTPLLEEEWLQEEGLTFAEDQLLQAMTHICESTELRQHYRAAAKKRALAYSPDAIVEQWIAILAGR